MSETPRTDAVVEKMQREEVSYYDAYLQLLELTKELEPSLAEARSPAPRQRNGRRPTSSTSKKKATRKPKSSLP